MATMSTKWNLGRTRFFRSLWACQRIGCVMPAYSDGTGKRVSDCVHFFYINRWHPMMNRLNFLFGTFKALHWSLQGSLLKSLRTIEDSIAIIAIVNTTFSTTCIRTNPTDSLSANNWGACPTGKTKNDCTVQESWVGSIRERERKNLKRGITVDAWEHSIVHNLWEILWFIMIYKLLRSLIRQPHLSISNLPEQSKLSYPLSHHLSHPSYSPLSRLPP